MPGTWIAVASADHVAAAPRAGLFAVSPEDFAVIEAALRDA